MLHFNSRCPWGMFYQRNRGAQVLKKKICEPIISVLKWLGCSLVSFFFFFFTCGNSPIDQLWYIFLQKQNSDMNTWCWLSVNQLIVLTLSYLQSQRGLHNGCGGLIYYLLNTFLWFIFCLTRQNGLGYTSFMSRLGVSVAPLILMLEDVWTVLPQIIICSVAIISGLVSLLLPETLNLRLPETIDDIEKPRSVNYYMN